MEVRWRLLPHDRDAIAALSREAGVPPLVAQLLLNRGVGEAAAAREFLSARRDALHDPSTMHGVGEAADRLVRAARAGRKIVVYGDYDVDGVCGTSILWACLKLAGARDVEYYIPHRVEEGYGVNGDALRYLANERKASVVVTVDCGVGGVREALLARELGLEYIVTDHHHIGDDLPAADVVVHPRHPLGAYPFGDLCGAGVAFKLAWQVCKSFGDGKKASPHLRDFLLRAINLVAMATVADVVPLRGENRIFVRHGLRGIVGTDASAGLKALLEVSNCLNKAKLSTGNIGFGLAPRINAAGRLERAMRAVELLTTDDGELALEIARELDECNTRRREVERGIVGEAHAMIEAQGGLGDRGAIVLGCKGWHAGVIGIVASRLVEAYHRPTVVVALGEDVGQGSARTVGDFHLYNALAACAEGLTSFGGHAAAAGLKIVPSRFEGFAERFDHHCRGALSAEHRVKSLLVDAEVSLGMLSIAVVEAIDEMEPFGNANPRPLLVAEGVHVVGEPKVVGIGHLKLRFGQGTASLPAIAFGQAEKLKGLKAGMRCAVAFEPSINEWNGRREVQIEVKDVQLRPDGAAADARIA